MALPGFAVLGAPQKEAAVGPEIVVHFESHFEIAELFIGNDDAAVAGDVLRPDHGPALNDPSASGLMFAGAAMAAFGADVPAAKCSSIKDRIKAVIGCWHGGRRGQQT